MCPNHVSYLCTITGERKFYVTLEIGISGLKTALAAGKWFVCIKVGNAILAFFCLYCALNVDPGIC